MNKLKVKRSNEQKGITLVALIITIIVLLILAVVSIRAVTGDGIIEYAENSVVKYEGKQSEEKDILQDYIYDIKIANGESVPISEALNKVLSKTKNVIVEDEYGNKMVVPAGFMIRFDGTTNNADNVTKGVVIEDCTDEGTKGSQFVWIPVGNVYTNKEKTTFKTITLGRYVFADGTTDLDGDGIILEAGEIVESLSTTDPTKQLKTDSTSTTYYTEGLKDDKTSNTQSKDIEGFITSANSNGGYYLGRYEARVVGGILDTSGMINNYTAPNNNQMWSGYKTEIGEDPQLVCTANNTVWAYVTQKKAADLSRNMYVNGIYTSDLVNSYAWDTALVFLQTFDDRQDKTTPYSREAIGGGISNTGKDTDKICNIYNMASNHSEWSTEASGEIGVYRKGETYQSGFYSSCRKRAGMLYASWVTAFRPILYV